MLLTVSTWIRKAFANVLVLVFNSIRLCVVLFHGLHDLQIAAERIKQMDNTLEKIEHGINISDVRINLEYKSGNFYVDKCFAVEFKIRIFKY